MATGTGQGAGHRARLSQTSSLALVIHFFFFYIGLHLLVPQPSTIAPSAGAKVSKPMHHQRLLLSQITLFITPSNHHHITILIKINVTTIVYEIPP